MSVAKADIDVGGVPVVSVESLPNLGGGVAQANLALASSEYASSQVDIRETSPGVVTFSFSYSYGILPGTRVRFTPVSSVDVIFAGDLTPGILSINGGSSSSRNLMQISAMFVIVRDIDCPISRPAEVPTPAFNPQRAFLRFSLGSWITVGTEPQFEQGGLYHGTQIAVMTVSFHPGVQAALGPFQDTGFVRDPATGVSVVDLAYDPLGLSVLALGRPRALPILAPGVGSVLVDDAVLFPANSGGGVTLTAQNPVQTSLLMSGFRSQFFRLTTNGVSAGEHIDW
ncbi:MAG: hypothetical protein ACON4Z_11020 [Planctomycetota bacterium]